jgi:hypothetical protein
MGEPCRGGPQECRGAGDLIQRLLARLPGADRLSDLVHHRVAVVRGRALVRLVRSRRGDGYGDPYDCGHDRIGKDHA